MKNSFELPPVCRQVIAELFEELTPDYRDAVGVIDCPKLTLAIMSEMEAHAPEVSELVRRHAHSVAVYQSVRHLIRTSKGSYVVHHREAVEPKIEARRRQRRMVTYWSPSVGGYVTKDRLKLSKADLQFVIADYSKRRTGIDDVLNWCRATWEQMDLLGLGDDALVEQVVTEEAA